MRIKFKENADQIELIKAMGSKDPAKSREACEIFAAYAGSIISEVIRQASTAGLIYTDKPFAEDDSPSIPLDLWYDESTNFVNVWSQTMAGGIPSSFVEGVAELRISTYRLDSAVSFLKKYARKANLDVVAKALERMAQEILVKQERNAWAVILKALAEATTNGLRHVVTPAAQNTFQVDDLSTLMTRLRRISASFAQGTPLGQDSAGLTNLFVSPEVKGQIRGFAYNPMNTKTPAGGTATSSSDAIALPDGVRENIYRSAGASEIFGVTITDLVELGAGRKYNILFKEFAGTSTDFGPTGAAFDATNDEILVGFDLGKEAFIRPVMRNEVGGTFTAVPDDQWVTRSEKQGFYGSMEEGRICVDAKGVCGLSI